MMEKSQRAVEETNQSELQAALQDFCSETTGSPRRLYARERSKAGQEPGCRDVPKLSTEPGTYGCSLWS